MWLMKWVEVPPILHRGKKEAQILYDLTKEINSEGELEISFWFKAVNLLGFTISRILFSDSRECQKLNIAFFLHRGLL